MPSFGAKLARMWDTPGRLLRLLSLLQLRRDWPGPELAARLEVDIRTVRRDIDRLRALGYPVSSTPGAAGGYRLEPGTDLPPLLLDDDEAVAVAVCLRTAAGGTVAGLEEAALRALAKLDRLLPTRLRGRPAPVRGHRGRDGPAPGPRRRRPRRHRGGLPRPRGPPLRLPHQRRARPAAARSSRSGSSTPGGSGTWSRGTATATTGGPSGSTASTAGRRRSTGSSRVRRRPMTSPPSSPAAPRSRPTPSRPGSSCTPRSPRPPPTSPPTPACSRPATSTLRPAHRRPLDPRAGPLPAGDRLDFTVEAPDELRPTSPRWRAPRRPRRGRRA